MCFIYVILVLYSVKHVVFHNNLLYVELLWVYTSIKANLVCVELDRLFGLTKCTESLFNVVYCA